MTEKIIYTIPAITKSSYFGLKQEIFSVIVTNIRVIFAKLTNAMLTNEMAQIKGASWLDKISIQMDIQKNYHKKYLNQDATAILSENSANFSFNLSDISEVEVKEIKYFKTGDVTPYYKYEILFVANNKKHKFSSNVDVRSDFKKSLGKKFN